ncbi:unnamed protein product [Caenorhabditis auriculariae]|uniref:Nucleoside transporter n=1 Tax=Caenorhabditis auriculariae TaxID=2777116 RepID=A0A8S1HGR8_9PELO|nr:unnamed protein product [Caenorhabditis auriculariae]
MVNVERLDADGETSGPIDKYNMVYYSVMIVGFGVLMPWNMFITIAPEYYVHYWFTVNGTQTWFSKEFMSSLSIAAQLPNASINILNLFLVISGPLIYRVLAPVVANIANVAAVLAMVIFLTPSVGSMVAFFSATIVIVVLINISNGLYENSVFGVFADFPHNYTSALVIGNNLCGLIISILSIIVTILLPEDPKSVAIVYFGISLLILVFCGLALLNITRQEFYHYHHIRGMEVREKASHEKPSPAILWSAFTSSWPQLFNVWFSFSVTLTIFPVMTTATSRSSDADIWDSYIPDHLFVHVTSFLVFNLFAFFGATLTSYVHFPSPRYLWILVTLRALFVPFFFFCNYRLADRVYPVYFESTGSFIAGGVLMALTSGYCSSLSMIYTPRVVQPSLSRFAAQLSVCCLMLGLFSGATFSLIIGRLIAWA